MYSFVYIEKLIVKNNYILFFLFDLFTRMNRLDVLPRGFGAFPVLEVLDLTYNNLNEKQLPGNFFMMGKRKYIFNEQKRFFKLNTMI